VAIATKQTTRDADPIEAVGDSTEALGTERSYDHRLADRSRDGGSLARRDAAYHAAARSVEPGQREVTRSSSFPALLELWIASWETALTALATATQTRTFGTAEAAAHRTVIAAEREVVTKHLARLVNQGRVASYG
jgi:hypothetical protein